MAAKTSQRTALPFLDKAPTQKMVEEQNARVGFVPEPGITPEMVQQMMRERGVRPEDNTGSCGVVKMRDE